MACCSAWRSFGSANVAPSVSRIWTLLMTGFGMTKNLSPLSMTCLATGASKVMNPSSWPALKLSSLVLPSTVTVMVRFSMHTGPPHQSDFALSTSSWLGV